MDAIEHFFWGRTNGLVMELGAGDGLPSTGQSYHQQTATNNQQITTLSTVNATPTIHPSALTLRLL